MIVEILSINRGSFSYFTKQEHSSEFIEIVSEIRSN